MLVDLITVAYIGPGQTTAGTNSGGGGGQQQPRRSNALKQNNPKDILSTPKMGK